MCGIAGVVEPAGTPVDLGIVARMTETLVHRGPDASGVESPAPHVGFGHRRLSIIDLAAGAQPMANAAGDVWITYNGEIFNYRELRADLEARGRVFATASDTEVLLATYEYDGVAGLQKLRGQYAFAIWDGRREQGRLIAARDPLGIKPFYFTVSGGRLLFASEPRAIHAHPAAPRTIDHHGLHLFLRYRFIPAPHTAWRDLYKLRPGEILTWQEGRVQIERPWRMRPEGIECDEDLASAPAALREELIRAVDRQKVADVDVGAFLSGGIDSSSTAELLMEVQPKPIRTFTIGFEDDQYDESGYAEQVAAHIGSHHLTEVMDEAAASEVIERILEHIDEPFGDPSLVPTWFLCGIAAKHHKVVLSGDGGDELFGGYGRTYRALGILQWPRLLRPFHRALQRLRKPILDPASWADDDERVGFEYSRLIADYDGADARRLYGKALRPCLSRGYDAPDPILEAFDRYVDYPPFSRILMADMEAHLADYHLVKVERASMAHGLEVRVPLLDLDFVERAFRWSAGVRLSGGRTKGLLRDAMLPHLPEIVMTRPKKGFGPPLGHWFKEGLGEFARSCLLDGAAVAQGLLDPKELRSMLDPNRKRLKGSRIWRLLVLEHWLRRELAAS